MSLVILSIFSVVVFLVRLALRKASRGEKLLMGFLLLHLLLIQAQIYLDIRAWVFDLRYHAPSYPLLFGWAAYPVVLACRRYRALTFVAIAAMLTLMYRMPRAENVAWSARHDGLAIYQRVAEVIREDWKGPSRDVRSSDDHEYRPSRRPSVAASPVVAYLVGGRQIRGEQNGWWRRPYDEWCEHPDYIFLSMFHEADPDFSEPLRVCESDEYDLVATITERNVRGRIFRRRMTEAERKGE